VQRSEIEEMPARTQSELYRELPSVDELLRSPELKETVARSGATVVTDATRMVLERLRKEIAEGRLEASGLQAELKRLPEIIELELKESFSFSLRPVINATGVILHTNLGRAPLSSEALTHIQKIVAGYSNLEFDLTSGERGKRDVHIQRLLGRLLKRHAPSGYDVNTVVVNNCAAAVMLALNTLAEGGEVIVSRGELVEIGGSFRVPEIMAKSGATLREVGTTNRTRIADYERAINERTRLLLRVHRSNFAIVGFTEQPAVEELVVLGRKHNIPVMEDLGNGAIFDLHAVGIQNESGVRDSLEAGIDIITYSGDKLLGGPQAGLISGRKEVVARIRSNPLFRALRVDKLTYAALEATLLAYLRADYDAVPTLRMMRLSAEGIKRRADEMAARLPRKQFELDVIAGESVIGGGTAPTATLPTFVLSLASTLLGPAELQKRLREHDPPIVVRIEEDRIRIDLRTVSPEHDAVIIDALLSIR
jgi:L-seryl-tRNA(Ser) seleniumtransferase